MPDLPNEIRLTPTSYIVLGLVDGLGEATPYRLKQLVAVSVGHFWSLQHAQLYTEPERLTRAGYLTEEREQEGRRRKLYRITNKGRAALREWTSTPTADLGELRDPGVLKLFLGADPAALAAVRLEAHRERLAAYEALSRDYVDMPKGLHLALECGIGHEREWIRFWKRLAK